MLYEKWQEAMTAVRLSGGWLAGFIDRPGKKSVLSMLTACRSINRASRPVTSIAPILLGGLTDTDLFDAVLSLGERSVVVRRCLRPQQHLRQQRCLTMKSVSSISRPAPANSS